MAKREGLGLNQRDRANQDTLNYQGAMYGGSFPTMQPDAGSLTITDDLTFVSATHHGLWINNTGDAGTSIITLPTITAAMKGKVFGVTALAAQILRVDPAAGEIIWLHGNGVASKYVALSDVISEYIVVYCDGIAWFVTEASGVVTKEG